MDRRTIAVLSGGLSAEREVSLRSGEFVVQALERAGHRVLPIDPAERDLAAIRWDQVECPPDLSDGRFSTTAVTSRPAPVTGVDVVFIALHGSFGEDGGVQEILEAQNIPYTGSAAAASRLAFSKSAAKARFVQVGIPTPRYRAIHFTDDEVRLHAAAEAIGYPLIVKPDQQGSSIGVSLVHSPEQLLPAAGACFRFDSSGLIEEAIPGAEWTVGVLDDEPLPAIRIQTSRTFFDYEAKYGDDATRYEFDESAEAIAERIVSVGLRACQAIGTRGLARADLRLDSFGQPWVLEVNTVPGLTDHSLVPKAALRLGWDMSTLCQRAIDSALQEHLRRQNTHGRRDRRRSDGRRRAG